MTEDQQAYWYDGGFDAALEFAIMAAPLQDMKAEAAYQQGFRAAIAAYRQELEKLRSHGHAVVYKSPPPENTH